MHYFYSIYSILLLFAVALAGCETKQCHCKDCGLPAQADSGRADAAVKDQGQTPDSGPVADKGTAGENLKPDTAKQPPADAAPDTQKPPPADAGFDTKQPPPMDAGPDTAKPATDSGTALPGWPSSFFAPFVDATLYPVLKLADVASQTGLKYFALGFIVAKQSTACTASWGTYYDITKGPTSWDSGKEYTLYSHIAQVRSTYKGDVMVSFGGAANIPLAEACTTKSALVQQYKTVINALSLTHVDFDIEGTWVTKHGAGGSITRRSQAIAQLQKDFAALKKPLSVWYTLPVLPTGLTLDGVKVVEDALNSGVELAGVNVMTMDYGNGAAPNPQGKMGAYGIQAITALHGQLKAAYQKFSKPKTDAALWAMIGTTPMIGMNDVKTEIFTLKDAQQTLTFAQQKKIGMISMWSLNRDHPCPTATSVQLKCSSTVDQTKDYQFSGVFKPFTP